MSNGISGPSGYVASTPNTVVQEGGMDFGSFSIQSLNTTVINQMYQNYSNMWGNITKFGNEMFDLAFKYTMWKKEQKKGKDKSRVAATTVAMSDPEVTKDFKDQRSKEIVGERNRYNEELQQDGPKSEQSEQDEIRVAAQGDVKTAPEPENYSEPSISTDEVIEEIGAKDEDEENDE